MPNNFSNISCSIASDPSTTGMDGVCTSADSRIMYVSTTGNNSTGQVYSKPSVEVGGDSFKPAGAIRPFATYAAVFANVRNGYPDWILFKRGETFYQAIESNVRSGRSNAEPFLIGAYGSSDLSTLLKIGIKTGISITKANCNHGTLKYIVVFDLRFCSHTRNPTDPEYIDSNGGGKPGL